MKVKTKSFRKEKHVPYCIALENVELNPDCPIT